MKRRKKKYNKRGRPRKNYEFHDAVEIVRKENIKSAHQYSHWWKLHTPSKLPKRPDRAYKKEWKGWGYFLGNYNDFPFVRQKYRSYEDAREYAHSLNLKTVSDWHKFAKSDKKPKDIPSRPDVVYQRGNKWHTWTDFLGNKIDIKVMQSKVKQKYFFIAKHPDTPNNVFYFGITTSKENLRKDNSFKVYKLYDYYDEFNWREVVEKYSSSQYDYLRNNEYLVKDVGGLLSELSLDLFEIQF